MVRQIVLTLLLLPYVIESQADNIIVHDAWIAEGPPSTAVNAGYLQIKNTGAATMRLTSVDSPAFNRIEMHASSTVNGSVSMRLIQHLDIAHNEEVEFSPGESHLMLYNTGQAPKYGETLSLTLRFADGTSNQVYARVRKMSDSHKDHSRNTETASRPDILAQARVMYQYLLPQHFLSGLMYRLTRMTWSPLKNMLIKYFVEMYKVDMSVAVRPDVMQYRHFNEFFTRELKADARPVDMATDAIVSPVDGAISQYGRIAEGKLIQAKGHHYSATDLLGGNDELGKLFYQGEFITLYLSPRDYHRIHMPVRGTLQSMTYVPGDLFSVSPATTQAINNLFARNERVVQIFETAMGRVALVMVGAIFVGSMETFWAGEITPAANRQPYTLNYSQSGQDIILDKGAEMGRFNMGSTVILLFEKGALQWDPLVGLDQAVRLGQKIATIKETSTN